LEIDTRLQTCKDENQTSKVCGLECTICCQEERDNVLAQLCAGYIQTAANVPASASHKNQTLEN
jgi:hypothetical protein